MVVYSVVDKKSYVIAITREGVDWKEFPLGADALARKCPAFRRGLDVGKARDASGKSGCSISRSPTSCMPRCSVRSRR